jgi:hypothetical protein
MLEFDACVGGDEVPVCLGMVGCRALECSAIKRSTCRLLGGRKGFVEWHGGVEAKSKSLCSFLMSRGQRRWLRAYLLASLLGTILPKG